MHWFAVAQNLPLQIFILAETVFPIIIIFGNTVSGSHMYPRILNLKKSSERRSLFLFGPRATGKSTLLKTTFPEAKWFDLLDAQTFGRLLRKPGLLAEETQAHELIVIDEIQKLPALLDEVHRLIASRNQRFILTGSSARKLKRGAANLLAGRARLSHLFPLTSPEIPEFSLETYLNTGGLPLIYGDNEAALDLRAYVDLYLREEVQAEALTRNAAGFGHLLDALALSNGQEINAQSLGSDVGLQARTVLNYIEILEDTLLGFRVPAFRETKKRKATSHARFYFFDVGVTNALCGRGKLTPKTELFGNALEHFILLEARAYLSYFNKIDELTFWRTNTGFEVDMVLGKEVAIEVKGTDLISDKHLKGLRAFKEENIVKRYLCVSLDSAPRKTEDGIEILPVQLFLKKLWAGELLP